MKGKTVGIDATMLEANAVLRSIARRDTGESYQDLQTKLAQASGVQTPTRADLARIDRKRKKKGANDASTASFWVSAVGAIRSHYTRCRIARGRLRQLEAITLLVVAGRPDATILRAGSKLETMRLTNSKWLMLNC